jgi:Leucine-rich repeat (LRR) protein
MATNVLDLTFLEIGNNLYDDVEKVVTEKRNMILESAEVMATITAVRLSYNSLKSSSIETILDILFKHMDCTRILWLDLSFNDLIDLPRDISSIFPNLTSLYLHANKIPKLSAVKDALSQCTNLHSLTMYGNPCESFKHYHNYALFLNPSLKQFDKSVITKKDKKQVIIFDAIFLVLHVTLFLA